MKHEDDPLARITMAYATQPPTTEEAHRLVDELNAQARRNRAEKDREYGEKLAVVLNAATAHKTGGPPSRHPPQGHAARRQPVTQAKVALARMDNRVRAMVRTGRKG